MSNIIKLVKEYVQQKANPVMGKKTFLYDYHARNGQIVEFAGYDMPMSYEGILKEVVATRMSASAFDVGHMGRIIFKGEDAGHFLDYVLTVQASALQPFQAKYSLIADEGGKIIDDAVLMKLNDEKFIIVVNAINKEKDLAWFREKASSYETGIDDMTDETSMIALQGPEAKKVLQPMCDADLGPMRRYRGGIVKVANLECIVSRTGYTGEDGFELIVIEGKRAIEIWVLLIGNGAKPAGLGARDVLRIEAGMPLYGNELIEGISPFEAGLDFAVNLEKGDFIGKRALAVARSRKEKHLVGIKLHEKRVPRKGDPIYIGSLEVGNVTSGTFSPTVNASIAMGYVNAQLQCGAEVFVGVRGQRIPSTITEMPFYDQKVYGWKRESSQPSSSG